MKKIYYVLLIFTLILSIVACSKDMNKALKKEEIKLYYGNLDNSKIQWVTRPVEYSTQIEKYTNTLKALINGPYSSDMSRNINENTQILSIKNNKDIVHIDLSKEFLKFPGDIGQLTAIMTIGNTLNQFKEINGVQVSVEGKELISSKGEPYGILREFNLNEEKKVAIKMYLPDENRQYLIPYKKEITLKGGDVVGKKLLQEIIKESTEKGYNIIPKGTKILNYSEDKGIATIDLSSEFLKKHIGSTTEETMTIYSIVNSLTELENITGVLFLIEGKKVEYFGDYEFDKPFSKYENLIKPVE